MASIKKRGRSGVNGIPRKRLRQRPTSNIRRLSVGARKKIIPTDDSLQSAAEVYQQKWKRSESAGISENRSLKSTSISRSEWLAALTGVPSEHDISIKRDFFLNVVQSRQLPGSGGIYVPEIELAVTPDSAFAVQHISLLPSSSLRLPRPRSCGIGGFMSAGSFYLASIGDLRQAAPLRPSTYSSGKQKSVCKCVLKIVQLKDRDSTRFVDVSALQADPANSGAVFQVASNFNCVESVSENIAPDAPNFLLNYAQDHTQGPAASISAAPGAISRMYAPFVTTDNIHNPSEWGQTAEKQVNMLEDLGSYFYVQNGYQVTSAEYCKPLPRGGAALDKLLCKVKVGVHLGAEVTYGPTDVQSGKVVGSDGITMLGEPRHKIDQVFCAALNLAQGELGVLNSSERPGANLRARFLIRAAYEGTYLAAVACGRSKLFLTMIGAGAFGNDPQMIFEEIYRAHSRIANGSRNSKLREVTIVLYSYYGKEVTEQFIHRLSGKEEGGGEPPVPFMYYECEGGRKVLKINGNRLNKKKKTEASERRCAAPAATKTRQRQTGKKKSTT